MIESLLLSLQVVRRNWTVYKKDLIANTSPSVADPLFLLISLGLGLGGYIQRIDGLSYTEFLGPGLIATTALFTSFFESSYGFYIRLTFENVFKAMLTTPIGIKEIFIGEMIWLFIKGTVMGLGVSLVLLCFKILLSPISLLWIPLLGGLIALPCGAIGLIASGYVRNINQFQIVYSFLIAPIYFLSGVFFPISNPIVAKIILISPFYHGVRLIQMSAWGRVNLQDFLFHMSALILFTLILSVWSYKRVVAKLQS
ncbi:MAG: ABC transporter permease [Bdellovibrionota bacterium]